MIINLLQIFVKNLDYWMLKSVITIFLELFNNQVKILMNLEIISTKTDTICCMNMRNFSKKKKSK